VTQIGSGDSHVSKSVWLAWHSHRRNQSLAALLGVQLRAVRLEWRGAIRHIGGTIWTAWTLARVRPHEVFVQNSFLLMLVCAGYKKVCWRRTLLVADCHNKSLRRQLPGILGPLFAALKSWSFRHADLVVVSNARIAAEAACLNSDVLVLRDPLPEIRQVGWRSDAPSNSEGAIVFVCSFGDDEPQEFLLSAADKLAACESKRVVVTGNVPARLRVAAETPHGGAARPGFLPQADYDRLLRTASVIVVLTNDTESLVCGAYEALSVRRPLVLSDHELLRRYFGRCAEYARHEFGSLSRALERAQTRGTGCVEYIRDWQRFVDGFDAEFEQLSARLSEFRRASEHSLNVPRKPARSA
jgi:hypothetical protein